MSISIIFLDLHSSEIFIQGLDLQLVDAINPKGLPLNKNCNSSLTFDFLCSTSIRLAVNQLKRKERKKMIAHSIVTSPLVKRTLYKCTLVKDSRFLHLECPNWSALLTGELKVSY